MKKIILPFLAMIVTARTAHADLPMGLKCDASIKIVGADIGEIGEYEVQIGMAKEKHRALLKRKVVKPVDGCHFKDITPGQTVVVRYSGPEVGENYVQCIDQNNGNALVEFPKSIYTVRNSNISQWMLMPYCPDGKSPNEFPCSKLDTQSQRSTYYQDTVLKWKDKKGNDAGKAKLHKIDMQFDPPYRGSVPSNAKLFCALVTRDGKVIMAGTAQYPVAEAPAAPAGRGERGADDRKKKSTDDDEAEDRDDSE